VLDRATVSRVAHLEPEQCKTEPGELLDSPQRTEADPAVVGAQRPGQLVDIVAGAVAIANLAASPASVATIKYRSACRTDQSYRGEDAAKQDRIQHIRTEIPAECCHHKRDDQNADRCWPTRRPNRPHNVAHHRGENVSRLIN
jgi:hypothetical protein